MTNAKFDSNARPTLLASLNTDGVTITQVLANSTSKSLKVDDNTTGSNNGNHGGNALIDDNSVAAMTAISSVDGVSITQLYADSTGKLLIQSA